MSAHFYHISLELFPEPQDTTKLNTLDTRPANSARAMEVFEAFQQHTKPSGQGRALDVLDVGTAARAILRRFYLLVARKV